jgi:hypothetical protein
MMIKISTRLVFVFKNIVIKIPINKKGYLQGLNEKEIWNKYKNKASLAELKWVFVGIVCQKRYDVCELIIPTREIKRIKSQIPEFNFNNCDLHNIKNWGKTENRYVLLDFGINEYIASLYK